MYMCQMHRYLSRDLTHMDDGNLCSVRIAILDKCQIHRYLSGDLTRIHKNKHYVNFAYFYVKMYDIVLFITQSDPHA